MLRLLMVAAVSLMLPAGLLAQEPHRFWDKKNVAAFTVMGAGIAADVQSSCRGFHRGIREGNPLLPETCKGMIWAGVAKQVGIIGVSYLFHRSNKRGAHAAERIIPYVWATTHFVAFGVNIRF